MTATAVLRVLYDDFTFWYRVSREHRQGDEPVVIVFLPEQYESLNAGEALDPHVWGLAQVRSYFQNGGQNPDEMEEFVRSADDDDAFLAAIVQYGARPGEHHASLFRIHRSSLN